VTASVDVDVIVGNANNVPHFNRPSKEKLAKYGEWRSTLRNWRLCQLQSHLTQKLGWISKIWP